MTALWTAAQAVAATGGACTGEWNAHGVAIDSRDTTAGDLFVALRGPNHDGHAFVADALARGAVAAMVDRALDAAQTPLLAVDDTLAGLERLGRAARARSQARVAAITGSVGKTGTKEALRHVLSRQAPTHASPASYNNHWGVPLTLARLPHDAAFAVLELGMNHAGEISLLTPQARPHVALVTAVEPAHLEFFGSIEAIADAKGEIFEGLEPQGVAVLNRDISTFDRLAAKARACAGRVATFGSDDRADYHLCDADLDAEGSTVRASLAGREITYRIGAPGRHWVMNSLAVLATAGALHADVVRAAAALAEFSPPAGRGARYQIATQDGPALLLDESYNANPASVRAALDVLGRMTGRRIAVLGDMRELGDTAPALHAALADAVAEVGVAQLYTCGPLMRCLFDAVPPALRGAHAADAQALLPSLRAALRAGDVILVKGSLGSRMGPIAQALRQGTASPRRRAG